MEDSAATSSDHSATSSAGPAMIALLFGGAILLLIRFLFQKKNNAQLNDVEETSLNTKQATGQKDSGDQRRESEKDTQRVVQNPKAKTKDSFTHPNLISTLRGHTGDICDGDFSASGKYLVTSSEDRSIHIWTCADFLTDNSQKEIRHHRLNFDRDHAALIRFSPDSKALLARMDFDNIVRVLKFIKKGDVNFGNLQPAIDIPKCSFGDILFMDINCNGKFIMIGYANTQINLWSIKGHLLATLLTNVATLFYCKVSPCGRFIAASGFTPDVKVWEVSFDKSISGDFHSVERAFELKGHSAGIPAVAFSGDSTHMVSVSKDKTFRLYDINVEYKKKQDARLVQVAAWIKEEVDVNRTQVALSNDSRCVVIASRMDIFIVSGVDGSVKAVIQSPVQGYIQKLMLDPSSGFIIAIGGRIARVFRNAHGYEITIDALKDKLKYATQDSIRERLQHQLADTEKVLSSCKR